MINRKMSFFEFWRSKKDREELLQRANQLRLVPSQLSPLLGDSGVRAALQNTRMVSLLPPVGVEVFRRFTPASLEKIQKQQEEAKECQATDTEVKESNRSKPASDLQPGKPLPFIYGATPPELLNTPLEELDPFYQSQKTFIVISKGNILSRFTAEPSCYLLSPFNPLRTAAIRTYLNSFFNLFILVTILTNCVFMTMSPPPSWIQTAEHVFTDIYMLEVVVKVVSRGFCVGKFTFLRDPWNWLDLMVISMAYLSYFVDLKKGSVLRTIPLVLKIISVSPGLKMTVGALVKSLKRLANVTVLMVFSLSLFALIGLQIFMGTLKNKCFKWGTGNSSYDYSEYSTNTSAIYYLPGQLDPLLCGNSSAAGTCPEGYICVKTGSNPNYGYTSYDSFGPTLLSVVRLMTKDFTQNLIALTLRSSGKTHLTFFAAIIFPGCFCLLSLVVVVVAMAIAEREEAGATEAKEREEEYRQIVEVLKRREMRKEEEVACRAAPSDGLDTAMEGSNKDWSSCSPCLSILANFLLKWNCCGCWRWLKQRLYTFITNPFFNHGIIICLIVNIIFMAVEHFPMTMQCEWSLSLAHLVFTAIFAAELVVKVVAMDPYKYFQVGWNIFDSILVVVSLLDLSFDVSLRSFLLLRVFRLARWWPSFHMLIKITWTSVTALRNLTALLLIMVFLFTVVGLQLFGKDYHDCSCRISMDCELPRWHMNDFFHAFMIIIRALFGEWIETLWDCMEVSGQTTCLIFYMTFMIIIKFLVLYLFLALLMSSFGSGGLAALEDKEKKQQIQIQNQISMAVGTLLGKKTHINPDHLVDNKEDNLALTIVATDQQVSEVKALGGDCLKTDSQLVYIADAAKMPEDEEKEEKKIQPEAEQHLGDGDHKGEGPEDCCSDKCYSCCPFLNIDTSQGIGRVWSNFRRACFSIVQHKCFETFIIVIILLSTAALMFEDIYLQHRPVLQTVLKRAEEVFTYLFLMEMVLKWIALGFKKYFTDPWCWLDFLILHVSLGSLAASTFGFSESMSVQFLRTLRALGPLRALSRFKGLRVVVQTVVRTVPSMCPVLLVSLTVWLIFGVLGVNLFAGKFYYCFNETSSEFFLHEDVNNKSECLLLIAYNFSEVRWKNLILNYDNVMNSYLSLLFLGVSGSADLIYAASDAVAVESQMIYEYNVYTYLYYVFFIIFGCFFTSIFLIRVIINHLQRYKSEGNLLFMSEKQQEFCKTMKRFVMKPQKPVPCPQNWFQTLLFDLVTKPCFEVFMVVVICLNMVILMIETDQQIALMDMILYWFHFSFILIFLVEFLLKIIALRQHYYKSGWNILDFVVLAMSIVGLFLSDLLELYFVSPALFSILRLGRVIRILFHNARGVRELLLAILMSLPAILNISLLLFILWITFSLFAMFNFAYVVKVADIDDMFNFETFGNSMTYLFMIATSSAWVDLLFPLMTAPPDCDLHMEHPGFTASGDCANTSVGIIFLTTNIVLFFLLGVHLYIAVVLETFNSEGAEMLSDSVSGEPISSTPERKQEDLAAMVIQRAYRKHVLQHRDAREAAVESVDDGAVV